MFDLVDIGINLAHDSFDADRDLVIERAIENGVRRMIVTGTDVPSTRAAIELARRHPDTIRATAGLHPHHAVSFDESLDADLCSLAREAEVVAVGECGLDFFRNYSPAADQERAFAAQLEIAARVQKPVFLHQRDAHDSFVRILDPYLPRIQGGVAHCFTGGRKELREYLDMGLYIGITGWICDERRAGPLREAVADLPLDRVLLETDGPYLLPRDLARRPSGRRNEPSVLPHILERLAVHMNQPPGRIAEVATRNAERLFGL